MMAVTGLLALVLLGAEGSPSENPPAPRETWALTLSEAIRVGLGHSESVRITCERVEEDDQVYVTIAPRDPAASPWRFRAETMALVRTIEQHYRELARQRAVLEASDQAVKTGRAILQRERADAAVTLHDRAADLADAETRLGEFEADRTTRRSDVAAAERQLRQVMGVATADSRAIVPVTPAVKTEVKADWTACLQAMAKSRPDLVAQRLAVSASGLRYLVACGPALLLANVASSADDDSAEPAQTTLLSEQAALERLLRKTVNRLSGCFTNVDSSYQQFAAASRLRSAAARRVEAQRTFYEEGRIPVDRYLNAVSELSRASAQEARFQCAYNVSLMALEEAKGTLLAYRQVTIEDAAERTDKMR